MKIFGLDEKVRKELTDAWERKGWYRTRIGTKKGKPWLRVKVPLPCTPFVSMKDNFKELERIGYIQQLKDHLHAYQPATPSKGALEVKNEHAIKFLKWVRARLEMDTAIIPRMIDRIIETWETSLDGIESTSKRAARARTLNDWIKGKDTTKRGRPKSAYKSIMDSKIVQAMLVSPSLAKGYMEEGKYYRPDFRDSLEYKEETARTKRMTRKEMTGMNDMSYEEITGEKELTYEEISGQKELTREEVTGEKKKPSKHKDEDGFKITLVQGNEQVESVEEYFERKERD